LFTAVIISFDTFNGRSRKWVHVATIPLSVPKGEASEFFLTSLGLSLIQFSFNELVMTRGVCLDSPLAVPSAERLIEGRRTLVSSDFGDEFKLTCVSLMPILGSKTSLTVDDFFID
jgi:hypothetical protein